MNMRKLIAVGLAAVLGLSAVGFVVVWETFRFEVPAGQCAVLIRKTGKPTPAGQTIAGPGEKGIQRDTLGPGMYFYNPVVWTWELHPLVEIAAGDPDSWGEDYDLNNPEYHTPVIKGELPEVGILVDRAGKPAPPDAKGEVVEPGYQGIQRTVLTPGVYRINPYLFEVKKQSAVVVPLGCVGIVTSQQGDAPGTETIEESTVAPDGSIVKGEPKSVQKLAEPGQRGVVREVLQPGIYYVNPYLQKVHVVWVGYNLMSQVKSSGVEDIIAFPSKDGFTIEVDVTVVWGLHPSHTPEMINRIGQAERIKQIILSQMRSICRNVGSNFVSTDFIQGERRAEYQNEVTRMLQNVCKKRDIEILIALIQDIEVRGGVSDAKSDQDLKRTIQAQFIAREQDLTKQRQTDAEKVKAELEAATAEINVKREEVSAETRKLVAETKAKAQKKSEEIAAQRDLEVAQLDRKAAEIDAETKRLLGKAGADVEMLKNRADADGRRLMIEAFGTGRAYNLYTFAEKFEPDSIRLFFAGDGTFWTDLSRLQDAGALEVLRKSREQNAKDDD